MSEADDLARRIHLERRDAERSLLQRLIELLETDHANHTYQQAYKRVLTKLAQTMK